MVWDGGWLVGRGMQSCRTKSKKAHLGVASLDAEHEAKVERSINFVSSLGWRHRSGRLMTLNMGPQHPSTHGVLRVVLELDGETICVPDPDWLSTHRD